MSKITTITLLAAAAGLAQPSIEQIKTVAEKTDYAETSKYADVIAFLQAVAKASGRVHLITFGATNEKRALPLAVIGAPNATPQAVRQTGKLRVYIQANIHGGEVEGKESAQMLVRDLAAGRHDDWLKTTVFLIAPIYNADGNERFALDNRGPQNGPLGGQGERSNAQGLDLNRDHMKLDSPEARAFVRLLNDYDPHVTMDLHTTNGTRHAYMLTYSPPLHPGTDPAVVELLRNEWLPAVTKRIREVDGWDFYYYGNVSGGEQRGASNGPTALSRTRERRWATFDHRPRFNNNYVGLRNRFAVLSEAYAYASFRDRVRATSRFLEENLMFVHRSAPRIRQLAETADRARLVGTRLPLRAEMRHTGTVEILMGEVEERTHPVDGHVMHVRKDVRKPEKMADYGTFGGVEMERVPATYYLPSHLADAIDRLSAHGIVNTPAKAGMKVAFEWFQIEGIESGAAPFQNRTPRTLRGAWKPIDGIIPPGTIAVEMSQPLARLAFYLLEPRSDDGLANWGLLDDALKEAKVYPIVRSQH